MKILYQVLIVFFIEQNGLPGNGICAPSDPNNPLAGNMCSTNLLNISGVDGQGNAMTLPGSDNLRISNWEKLRLIYLNLNIRKSL